jgi:hypothetical protein
MQERSADVGPLAEAIEHFCHITDNFAPGLFHGYDVKFAIQPKKQSITYPSNLPS